MRKILIMNILCWILFSCQAAENPEFPKWMEDLRLDASKTLQTEITAERVNIPDRLSDGKHFVCFLKGEGSLEKVKNPFETVDTLFSSNGWKYVMDYAADGHGSSSFAYEKENQFCNIYVRIDSSDEDEETGHIPSKFWVEIYCREK